MANRINPRFIFVCMLLLLAGCSSKPVRHDTPNDAGARQGSNPHRHYPMYTDDDMEPRQRGGRSSQVFLRPADIEPQVAFWRKVYSKWGRSQVAIHDKVHMDIIYDVFELPGEVSDILTASQKDYIQERFYGWKSRLSALEDKMAAGMALDADENELVQHIAQKTGHRNAIQGASERLRHQRGLKERFKRGLEISRRYDSQFRQIFRNAGLPEDLAYLPHVESSFQYNAHSSAGALGIWQFTSGAAKIFMNGDASAEARLDPINSTRGAARYLSAAYEKLGSWPLAVTSYNHGIGGMQRAKNLYGHDFMRIVKHYDHPQFGFASRNYYAEFLAAMDIASDPERYFAQGADDEN
jgi:membrane-bound lytic murein transglycosylase D